MPPLKISHIHIHTHTQRHGHTAQMLETDNLMVLSSSKRILPCSCPFLQVASHPFLNNHKDKKTHKVIWPQDTKIAASNLAPRLPGCSSQFLQGTPGSWSPLKIGAASFLPMSTENTVKQQKFTRPCVCLGVRACIQYYCQYCLGLKCWRWKVREWVESEQLVLSPSLPLIDSGMLVCWFHVINLNCLFTEGWTDLKKPANVR